MQHRTYRYKIQYLGDAGERGREWCTVSVHRNGDRTMRALCEMDDTQIIRDVTATVDEAWRPKDAFVRVSVRDEFVGSSWFRFQDKLVECEAFTKNEGRISQELTFPTRPKAFVTHPVACDVWHFADIDRTHGEVQESLCATCSPLPDGASGPMLGRSLHRHIYRGVEEVDCPVGRFSCEHVSYVDGEGRVRLDAWCTREDRVLVQMRFDVLKTSYQLVALDGDVLDQRL